MPRKLTIDERVLRLEARLLPQGAMPGTQIIRILAPVHGVEWCVSIAQMAIPCRHKASGATIDAALALLERSVGL